MPFPAHGPEPCAYPVSPLTRVGHNLEVVSGWASPAITAGGVPVVQQGYGRVTVQRAVRTPMVEQHRAGLSDERTWWDVEHHHDVVTGQVWSFGCSLVGCLHLPNPGTKRSDLFVLPLMLPGVT